MMTYKTLSSQPQSFLALTGLTNAEFGKLLPAFQAAYARAHPMDQTATGQPRQRWPARVGRVPSRTMRTNCCSSWST